MPRPRAAEYFGFSRNRPIRSYSPNYAIPNQYDMALGDYGPLDQLKQDLADQAEAELLGSQMNGADSIPAIQKLVAAGAMTPQQGANMAKIQKPRQMAGNIPEQVARGIQELSMINPSDERARDMAMQVFQNRPELFTHNAGVAAINRLNQALDKSMASQRLSKQDQLRLQMALGPALQRPTDEQKIEAAMKADRSLTTRPTEKRPWEPEPWRIGWHKVMDPRIQSLRGTIQSMLQLNKPVPDELAAWAMSGSDEPPTPAMLGLQQQSPTAMQSTSPQQAPQSTEQPQAQTPNQMHIWALKQDPSLAPHFDAKFGQGAAARVLAQP